MVSMNVIDKLSITPWSEKALGGLKDFQAPSGSLRAASPNTPCVSPKIHEDHLEQCQSAAAAWKAPPASSPWNAPAQERIRPVGYS